MNDHKTRALLSAAFFLAVLGAIYGSLLPLKYHPRSFKETLDIFLAIPWFDLGLSKRADWFANGLVILPVGFFYSGAVIWKQENRLLQITLVGVFIFLLTSLICVIEFSQAWFPPRVQSLNDMAAGFIGGVIGFAAWPIFGNRAIRYLTDFRKADFGIERIYLSAKLFVILLLASSLLPLDLVISTSEFTEKLNQGKVNLIPFADWHGLGDVLHSLLTGCWGIPVGIIFTLHLGAARSVKCLLIIGIAVELITLPIYSRWTSSTGIVLNLFMIELGILVTPKISSTLKVLNTRANWFVLSILYSFLLLLVFASRADGVEQDVTILQQRADGFLATPFASAQRSTEFQAIENIAGKVFLFMLLGFILHGWSFQCKVSNDSGSRFSAVKFVVFNWIMFLAILIEATQIFLPPLVPESTDVIIYCIGGSLGLYAGQQLIFPDIGQGSSRES